MTRTRHIARRAALLLPAVLLAACSSGGTASDPGADTAAPSTTTKVAGDHEHDHDHDHGAMAGGNATAPSAAGFTLTPATTALPAGFAGELAFSILDDTGAAVTDFDVTHEKPMHLLLVNHALTEYHHLHPQMDADGTWTVDVAFASDGFFRMVADFKSGGTPVALGTDLVVGSAPMRMADISADERTAVSGPYTAVLSGDTAHEAARPLKVTFTRDGAPVTTVNPYLGANAHMVGFAASDLGFVHLHPNDGFTGGVMTFTAPPLEHGYYKFFLQADFDGELRLFEFAIYGK